MIRFEDVTFGFPQKDLYDAISFEIEDGEHAVLIGSNGTGKTSLIHLMTDPDHYTWEGKIHLDEHARIGFVDQFVKHEPGDMTAFEYLAAPFAQLQKRSDDICKEMEKGENMEELCDLYQQILDEMDAVDAYDHEVNIKKELAVAGLAGIENNSIKNISGGEYKLLSIIRSMLLKPQLLIMDEPDVFLDFENLVGLTRLINGYEGTILAITHNRLLLNQCFDKILHLENKQLQQFPGTFAEYNRSLLETKIDMLEHASKFDEFMDIQRANIERMRDDATEKADPRKGRQLKARVSYLERLKVQKGSYPFIENHRYDIVFPQVEVSEEPSEEPVLSVQNYSLSYDRDILKNVSFTVLPGEKVAIVGANGTGKSSLLRDVYDMVKEGGKAAFFTQIYDDEKGEKLSGGERNIRQLMEICQSGARILFLDEPNSHLDIYAQTALEKAVNEYKGTVLMVSHDFYTVTGCADRILILENGSLREMSGRAYRKSIYKKYFDSDIFEQERLAKEKEMRINALIASRKYKEAREIFATL